jgi:hypothetical protein
VVSANKERRHSKPAIVKSARKIQQRKLDEKVDLEEIEADLQQFIKQIDK